MGWKCTLNQYRLALSIFNKLAKSEQCDRWIQEPHHPDVAEGQNYFGSLRLFWCPASVPRLANLPILTRLHLNSLSFYSIYASIAGRFYRRGKVITLTIHSISGYTCLYSAFMQLYAYSLHCCSKFQPVMHFLRCLINHSFSFSSGYIKWVIFTKYTWQGHFHVISVCFDLVSFSMK